MKKIYIMVLILFTHINALAQWNAISKVDDFTDEKSSYIAYEDSHHKVQISGDGGTSESWIYITRKDLGIINHDAPIKFRVDKKKLYEIDFPLRKSTLPEYVFINHNTIAFRFMGILVPGLLTDLIEGNYLNIQYNVNDIQVQTTKIPLKGLASAAYKVFGKKDVDFYCRFFR